MDPDTKFMLASLGLWLALFGLCGLFVWLLSL